MIDLLQHAQISTDTHLWDQLGTRDGLNTHQLRGGSQLAVQRDDSEINWEK